MRNLFVTVLAALILLDRSSTYLFKCARWSSLLLWLGVIACGRLLAYV